MNSHDNETPETTDEDKPRQSPPQCGEPSAQFGEPHAQCGETSDEEGR